jgi:hypothetical protein
MILIKSETVASFATLPESFLIEDQVLRSLILKPPNIPTIEDHTATPNPSIIIGTLAFISALSKRIQPNAIPKNVPKIPKLVSMEGALRTVCAE